MADWVPTLDDWENAEEVEAAPRPMGKIGSGAPRQYMGAQDVGGGAPDPGAEARFWESAGRFNPAAGMQMSDVVEGPMAALENPQLLADSLEHAFVEPGREQRDKAEALMAKGWNGEGGLSGLAEATGRYVAAGVPVFGPMAANAGENLGNEAAHGNYAGAAGTTAGMTATLASSSPTALRMIPKATGAMVRGAGAALPATVDAAYIAAQAAKARAGGPIARLAGNRAMANQAALSAPAGSKAVAALDAAKGDLVANPPKPAFTRSGLAAGEEALAESRATNVGKQSRGLAGQRSLSSRTLPSLDAAIKAAQAVIKDPAVTSATRSAHRQMVTKLTEWQKKLYSATRKGDAPATTVNKLRSEIENALKEAERVGQKPGSDIMKPSDSRAGILRKLAEGFNETLDKDFPALREARTSAKAGELRAETARAAAEGKGQPGLFTMQGAIQTAKSLAGPKGIVRAAGGLATKGASLAAEAAWKSPIARSGRQYAWSKVAQMAEKARAEGQAVLDAKKRAQSAQATAAPSPSTPAPGQTAPIPQPPSAPTPGPTLAPNGRTVIMPEQPAVAAAKVVKKARARKATPPPAAAAPPPIITGRGAVPVAPARPPLPENVGVAEPMPPLSSPTSAPSAATAPAGLDPETLRAIIREELGRGGAPAQGRPSGRMPSLDEVRLPDEGARTAPVEGPGIEKMMELQGQAGEVLAQHGPNAALKFLVDAGVPEFNAKAILDAAKRRGQPKPAPASEAPPEEPAPAPAPRREISPEDEYQRRSRYTRPWGG